MAFKAKNYRIQNLSTFRLGLNTKQSPDEIQDSELAYVENFVAESDSLASSPGYSTYDSDIQAHPGPYLGGYMFAKSDGSMVDVRQRIDKLEYSIMGDGVWVECTLPTAGSPAATISLTQTQCTFAVLNDIMVWTNGIDTVMSSTDGITWTLEPTLPISKVVFENAKNRLIYLGQKDSPYQISWSGINSPLTIGANSFQLVDPNNHGKIVGAGLTPEGSTLIFKESGLYNISDYVDDGIIDMNFVGTITCLNHQSIVTTSNSVIWCGFAALYEFIGGQVRQIAGRISWEGEYAINESSGFLACAAFYNGKYYLSLPDARISELYNAVEFVIDTNLRRDDALQPYVITRNKRFFGMYFKETFEFDYGLDDTLYVGDSRSIELLPTSGSPAVMENPIFAWLNAFRSVSSPFYAIEEGLGGYSQPAEFQTKYFTNDVPFFVKKYKKVFANCKFSDRLDIMVGYRFDPFEEYTMVTVPVETQQIPWLLEDGNTGNFVEGFGFSQASIANIFIDIENAEKPRGIQFRVKINEIKDVTNFGMAYKYQVKQNFK